MKLEEVTREQMQAALAKDARRSKYGNRKVYTEYGVFDSAGEHEYWLHLCDRQWAGEITDLDRQVTFPLVVNGVCVAKYVADYVWTENGQRIVADFKGFQTAMSRIKLRLMRAVLGIDVRIIRKGDAALVQQALEVKGE